MARGRVTRGLAVSAAVVPTSSIPTKAKTASWKPLTNPANFVGNIPPWLHRWETEAVVPSGEVKPTITMNEATPTSATIATNLTIANQNSISPNSLTEARFMTRRAWLWAVVRTIASHRQSSPSQYSQYPVMATTSAIPMTTQLNQYVHPTKKPAHGPRMSAAKSWKERYSSLCRSSSPMARITKYSMKPMTA